MEVAESHSRQDIRGASPGSTSVFSLSRERVLLVTIILMSVGVAGGAGADLPPERTDDGRGSYEMVDILAIASGWSTVAVRETLQRDRAVQSPYIRCYEVNPPLSCAVLVSARYRESALLRREGISPSALGHPRCHPSSREPPRALNINRSAAERSAARGASLSSLHLSSQPTADDKIREGFLTSTIHSEERSVVREGRQLPSPSPGSDSSR